MLPHGGGFRHSSLWHVPLILNVFYLYTGIPPNKYQYIDDLVVIVPQNVWEYLYNR